jgi:hypothetical protein
MDEPVRLAHETLEAIEHGGCTAAHDSSDRSDARRGQANEKS